MPELPSRLQVGTSFEQAMPLLNNVLNELDSENRTKIIYNGNVPQVLFGYQKGGFVDSRGNSVDYGLKVSRIDQVTGIPYDVTTATDEQLQFTTAVDTRLMYNQHVPQLLFGYQNGGFGGQSYGLKVSKVNPGTGLPYDVRTAIGNELAFSTAFNYLKVVKTGTLTASATYNHLTDSYKDTSVAHGLSSAPPFVAFAVDPTFGSTGSFQLPWTVSAQFLDADGKQFHADDVKVTAFTDNTNFTVRVSDDRWISNVGDYYQDSYLIRYYIFEESLA